MRRAFVALLLVACLWAAAPASGSERVYDPDGPTATRHDHCRRADGAFMVDVVAWADVVKLAINAYMVEDFATAKKLIVEAKRVYWGAYEPCSSAAKSVDRTCELATNYYAIGIEAAAKADPDRAFRYMRLGHHWIQKTTKAVRRLRAYYHQL